MNSIKKLFGPSHGLLPIQKGCEDYVGKADVVIALMGTTGTGKSSFIQQIIGGTPPNKYSIHSQTKIITATSWKHGNQNVVFIDTPGVGVDGYTDVKILETIGKILNKKHSKRRLAAIIYCCKVSEDVVVDPAPIKNLQTFQTLCGTTDSSKIPIVTTMWDEVDEEIGAMREKSIIEKHWNKHVKIFRHSNDQAQVSAHRIVIPYIESS